MTKNDESIECNSAVPKQETSAAYRKADLWIGGLATASVAAGATVVWGIPAKVVPQSTGTPLAILCGLLVAATVIAVAIGLRGERRQNGKRQHG